ncbi:MAG: hypothetical protein AUK51_15735 [Comamonadaceae bacterium CG2_30_59_20]|nr:MAG: hypothetical protein AUK51_15735 [Comamonadaceae bacterium CG2_30_59_20]
MARSEESLKQRRKVQISIQQREVQTKTRWRNLDIRQLRRPRFFQPLRIVWPKADFKLVQHFGC